MVSVLCTLVEGGDSPVTNGVGANAPAKLTASFAGTQREAINVIINLFSLKGPTKIRVFLNYFMIKNIYK